MPPQFHGFYIKYLIIKILYCGKTEFISFGMLLTGKIGKMNGKFNTELKRSKRSR